MSNLSEEEAIKTIEKLEKYISLEMLDMNKSKELSDLFAKSICAFQVIKNTINKEKEKNKELLEGLKYRVNYCKLLEKELYSCGVNYEMELTKIEEKYLQELLEGDDK